MEWATLERILEWFENGKIEPDNPLHLHLFGDPMVYPDFEAMAKRVKEVCPHISFSTNGHNLDFERGHRLKEIGFDYITVSPHDMNRAISALYLLRGCGIETVMQNGPDHNWAGQVDHLSLWRMPCEFEYMQKAVVRWNGDVAVCCITDGPQGVIGTVWDEDLPEKELEAFELCKTCHLVRQGGMR
jgi:hypothetical protein